MIREYSLDTTEVWVACKLEDRDRRVANIGSVLCSACKLEDGFKLEVGLKIAVHCTKAIAAVARDRKEDSNEIAVHCARVNGNLGHKMENYDSSIKYATGCEVHLVVCSCPERPT